MPSSLLLDQSLLVVSLQGTCCRSYYVSVDDPDLSPPAACDLVVISMPVLPPVVSGFLFLPHLVSRSPGGGAAVTGGSSWNRAVAPWATLCSVPALVGAGSPSPKESSAITGVGARLMLSCPVLAWGSLGCMLMGKAETQGLGAEKGAVRRPALLVQGLWAVL